MAPFGAWPWQETAVLTSQAMRPVDSTKRPISEQLVNFVWRTGIRAFRLSRRANLSTRLEPAFVLLANLVPSSRQATEAMLTNGRTLTMPPGYRDARTVITGLFQKDQTDLLQAIIREGMIFADVGAYVGYFTVLASTLVGSTGRVFAFEPDSLAFDFLTKNISSNRFTNVVAINKAVSDTVGMARLERDQQGPESYISILPPGPGSHRVETLSLDAYFDQLNWSRVDVVKMNIEGSEIAALRGMREVSHQNPDLQLVIEFNAKAMSRAGVSPQALETTLRELGFRHGRIVERKLTAVPDGALLPNGRAVYNILLTK